MTADNNGNPMNFTALQLLILEKQKIERDISAMRVINLRVARRLVTNAHILAMADKVEAMISRVNYTQFELDELLTKIEADLDIDFS